MSIGNTKTQGNKGNNFPYQLRELQILGEISTSVAPLTDLIDLLTDIVNNQTAMASSIEEIKNNSISKIDRISGAANYSRTLTYNSNNDVTTITHVGTTELGVETILESLTYDVNGNVTNINYI
jgi:hypothetical protein